MAVASRPDEIADLQPCDLGDDAGQERVAGDVEGHTQEHVGTALEQMARELPVHDVELEHDVAWRQWHVVDLIGVPRGHDQSARIGRLLDLLDYFCQLIDLAPARCRPGPPLNAVDRTEVAILLREGFVFQHSLFECLHLKFPLFGVCRRNRLLCLFQVVLEGPLGPDVAVVFQKEPDVAVALQEPDEFDQDQPERHELRGDKGKPLAQVVPDLTSEDAHCSGSGSVALVGADLHDLSQEILVWCRNLFRLRCYTCHFSPRELMR